MASPQVNHPYDIVERAFEFAIDVVNACRRLEARSWVARTLGTQFLRAGTSTGANMEESQAAQSRRDFVNKCMIALKEARESTYWLRLMRVTGIMPDDEATPMLQEATEIRNIIGSIVVATKRNGL